MRAGRVEEADAIAERIRAEIVKRNSIRLHKYDGRRRGICAKCGVYKNQFFFIMPRP